MTVESLKDCNKKILVQMAKDRGIAGWHAMRKDQLIRALAPTGSGKRSSGTSLANSSRRSGVKSRSAGEKHAPKASARRTESAKSNGELDRTAKPMAALPPRRLDHASAKDRVVVIVRDPFWIQAYWELSRSTLARAQAALGQDWHGATPILRLMDVTSEDTTASAERHLRDISIHGGVSTWYVDVESLRSYRIDVGYLSRRGKFFVLARSNIVTTPKAGVSDAIDETWLNMNGQFDRIYHQSGGANPATVSSDLRELFEERLRRPMQSMSLQGLGLGGLPSRKFHFELDAELIVYGSTEPNARVSLQGEPVPLRSDGTFSVRFSLPDCRQILPAVASSADGIEERTIVLAVERNTKELEPMIHDGNEL